MIKPETVKAFRRQNNLTRGELAAIAGVSVHTVRLTWEKTGITDEHLRRSIIVCEMHQFQKLADIDANTNEDN